jgi:hypothetical protein
MLYRTTPRQEMDLLSKPESGMGYQLVQFRLVHNGALRHAVAYNAQVLVEWDEHFEAGRQVLWARSVHALASDTRFAQSLEKAVDLRVVSSLPSLSSGMVAEPPGLKCGRIAGVQDASTSPEISANGEEEFVRLSAYADDKRVDQLNKSLLPGTYATTWKDYWLCVKCPDEPIDRYALPNDEKITTAFHVRPLIGDILQIGRVQPNFGHQGGGEEALFKNGTSKGSLIRTEPYGQ